MSELKLASGSDREIGRRLIEQLSTQPERVEAAIMAQFKLPLIPLWRLILLGPAS